MENRSSNTNVLKPVLWIALTLSAAISLGEDDVRSRLCEVAPNNVLNDVAISARPSFFIRTLPEKNAVIYHTYPNKLLDLESGHETNIPSGIDPVPTEDGKYLTFPGLVFYPLTTGDSRGDRILYDSTNGADYQSVATVKNGEDKSIYRVATSSGGISIRDYEITHAKGGNPASGRALGETKKACEGHSLSLPMISKDGKQVSGVDYSSTPPVTKVFDINLELGTCKEAYSLGIATGKVDFNFDGTQIAFHVFNQENQNGVFGSPGEQWTGNVYVYDTRTKKIKRITHNTELNSVYPSWMKDGTLVYLNHKKAFSEGPPARFVRVSVNEAPEADLAAITRATGTDPEDKKRWHAAASLGMLWSRVCVRGGSEISPGHAALSVLSLGNKECKELVESFWESKKNEVREHFPSGTSTIDRDFVSSLSKQDLLAACPTHERKTSAGVSPAKPDPARPAARPKDPRVPQGCRDCHPGIPFDDVERLRRLRNADGKPMVDVILDRVSRTGPGKMPPFGNAMTEQQQEELRRYLTGSESTERPAPTPTPSH